MKAQLEIFGIAIVMVLMLLALVVYLQLSSTPNNEVLSFTSQTLPTQLISVILKTSTNCNDQNIETLLVDISKSISGQSFVYSNMIHCTVLTQTETSLSIAEESISSILEESLGTSNYNYEFLVSQNEFPLVAINSSQDCSKARKVDADAFSIKGTGIVDVSLRIC